METVQLTTSDGHALVADVADPPDGVTARGGVAICHPHPEYGGNRFNNVVEALFTALPRAGFRALRFDFRRDHGGGVAERLDVIAAVDHLERLGSGTGHLYLAGYSFGAAVALNTSDPRIAAVAAIAPPLAMMDTSPPAVPTLVLTPAHDQFSPPDSTRPIVAAWPTVEFEVIESADHFLVGRTALVAERTADWLVALTA